MRERVTHVGGIAVGGHTQNAVLFAGKCLCAPERRSGCPAIAQRRRRDRDTGERIDAIGHDLRRPLVGLQRAFGVADAQRGKGIVQQILLFVRRTLEGPRERVERIVIVGSHR